MSSEKSADDFFFNPHSPISTSSPSPHLFLPLLLLLSPTVYTSTWLLTIQLAFWIFHYVLNLVCFYSRAWLGKKQKYLESIPEPKKLAILIASAQLLVLGYINAIHCVSGEDSIANMLAAVWLTLQQLWTGKWKLFKEEKNYILAYLAMQVSIMLLCCQENFGVVNFFPVCNQEYCSISVKSVPNQVKVTKTSFWQ